MWASYGQTTAQECGVGLGKTHLMHAVGNLIIAQKPGAQVVYLHSERFVADMVKALQHNAIARDQILWRDLVAELGHPAVDGHPPFGNEAIGLPP